MRVCRVYKWCRVYTIETWRSFILSNVVGTQWKTFLNRSSFSSSFLYRRRRKLSRWKSILSCAIARGNTVEIITVSRVNYLFDCILDRPSISFSKTRRWFPLQIANLQDPRSVLIRRSEASNRGKTYLETSLRPISLGSWLTSIAIRSNYIREQITLRIVLRIFSTIPSRFQFLIIQTFRDNYIIRPKIVQQYNKLYRSRQRSRGEGDLQKMIQPLIHSFEHTFDRCGNSLRRCLLPKSSERIVERQRHGWTKRSNEQPSNRIVPVNVVFPCDSFACGRTRPKDRVIATTLHLYPPNDRSTPSSVS